MRKRFDVWGLAAALAVLWIGMSPAAAQEEAEVKERLKETKPADFPAQPIELVVVYPAGGGMDFTARVLGKYLEEYIGSPVIVTNKTGGGGVVGQAFLTSQAPNDGYTVGVVSNGIWSNTVLRSGGAWSYENLDPIAFINYAPLSWIVSTEGPFKDMKLQEIVEAAKEEPGSVRVGTVPNLSSDFLIEMVEASAGTDLVGVPFQGGAPSIAALLGGHIEISFGYASEYQGYLDAGQVKVIGFASDKRVPSMPDVPTFNEVLGTTEIVWPVWRYVGLPDGVPEDRKAWLADAFNAALSDPDLAKEYAAAGTIVDRSLGTAEAVAAEVDKLAKLTKNYLVESGRAK